MATDAERRYHRPLTEVAEDELFLAVRRKHADAAECRAELNARGFNDEYIDSVLAPPSLTGRW